MGFGGRILIALTLAMLLGSGAEPDVKPTIHYEAPAGFSRGSGGAHV